MIVTIDGPAGAGKSTVAKMLSEHVGFQHLDSGAFYRCYAWQAKQLKTELDQPSEIQSLLESVELTVNFQQTPPVYFVNGKNVSKDIRTNEVSRVTSNVSQVPEVREIVNSALRKETSSGNFVIEGRDIGSVVFPNAEYKFYLTASIEERAKRRFKELKESGEFVELTQLQEDIRKRDELDSNRKISPLIQPEDAILIDCTDLSINQVIENMSNFIKN
jgi:cytidylate kinase